MAAEKPDLNLLFVLDALLNKQSIASAARQFNLSQSAMSRSVARLRATIGDPLLVRAGSKFVLTPRAVAMKERVHTLVRDAEELMRPAEDLLPGSLCQDFTIMVGEGFAETFGPSLISTIIGKAPGVKLLFTSKQDGSSDLLREGSVDLEIGVISSNTAPEIRVRGLFRDRFIGVVRKGHPISGHSVGLPEYLAYGHVAIHRSGLRGGPVDRALASRDHSRNVVISVNGFTTALSIARGSDYIATVPEKSTGGLRDDLSSFELPFEVKEVTVSLMWHPRNEEDPANRWLRDQIVDICAASSRHHPLKPSERL